MDRGVALVEVNKVAQCLAQYFNEQIMICVNRCTHAAHPSPFPMPANHDGTCRL